MKMFMEEFKVLDMSELIVVNGGYSSYSGYSSGSYGAVTSGGSNSSEPEHSVVPVGYVPGKGWLPGYGPDADGSGGKPKMPGDEKTSGVPDVGGNDPNATEDDTSKSEVRNGISTPLGDFFDDLVVSSEWGDRTSFETPNGTTSEGHNGMDFAAPKGTRINAVMDGEVTYVDNTGAGGYGKVVIITHSSGAKTLYAHQDLINIKVGDLVEAGQKIGEVGSTGLSTGNHLHFGYDGNGDGIFSRTDHCDNPAQLFYTGYEYE